MPDCAADKRCPSTFLLDFNWLALDKITGSQQRPVKNVTITQPRGGEWTYSLMKLFLQKPAQLSAGSGLGLETLKYLNDSVK